MKKITVHLRIPEDVVSMIENAMQGENRTEKIQNFVCSSTIGMDVLKQEKQLCEQRIKFIDDALKNNPFYTQDALSKEELENFAEVNKARKREEFNSTNNPGFIGVRCRMHNEKFGRNLTTKEFELLLYKAEEKKE